MVDHRDDVFRGTSLCGPILYIIVDLIDTVSIFSKLGHVYGVLKSISNLQRASLGTFYITVVPDGASWAYCYLL